MKISRDIKKKFHNNLLTWYRKNKRDFPWRSCNDPYKILISEVLLQKTDAPKVLPVYKKFIKKYPSIKKLQKAKVSDIKKIIKGLGLLYRAERLISIAKTISFQHHGDVPSEANNLIKLKGLGKYAASAVMCFAFNEKVAIVDNNVVRMIERIFGYKSRKNRPRDDTSLWKIAESILPSRRYKDYNYALLDFSALQCTARNPQHKICPLKNICKYYKNKVLRKNKPIGIDLYAGAGGLSLGFEHAGFDIKYAIENDKFAALTYKNNRKNNTLIVDTRDINIISPKDIIKRLGIKKGELDIIIGGPPCQGFSTSNMRTRNMANPQNQLVFKFIEFLKDIKPKWFLMENVAGLDSFEDGALRDKLLKIFKNLGYSAGCMILNSVNFGIPQSRSRIFFIGNNIGESMKFFDKIKNKKIKQTVTVLEAISDLPILKNGHSIDEMSYNKRKKKLTKYQIRMRKGLNGKVTNNLVSRNTDLVLKRYKYIKQGENLLVLAKKKPELVRNYKKVSNCHSWIYMRLYANKPSVTLNNYRKNMLIHPLQDRGLSVREAARLQSFPDHYIFYGPLGYQQQQVSNAVPFLLSKEIANNIPKHT